MEQKRRTLFGCKGANIGQTLCSKVMLYTRDFVTSRYFGIITFNFKINKFLNIYCCKLYLALS